MANLREAIYPPNVISFRQKGREIRDRKIFDKAGRLLTTTFATIALIGVCNGLIQEYDDAQRETAQIERTLSTLSSESSPFAHNGMRLEVETTKPEDKIRKHINKYIGAQIGIGPNEGYPKDLNIVRTEPVQITVAEPKGVWVRDFPDEIYGKRVKSTGSPDGAFYKAYKKDPRPLPGVFSYFIWSTDKTTGKISLWTARWSEEHLKSENGEFIFTKEPAFETFQVFDGDKWNVLFQGEDLTQPNGVGEISGEKLFAQANPRIEPDYFRPETQVELRKL